MKTDANWCVRCFTLVLVLTLAFAAMSCGGGGGSVDLKPSNNGAGVSDVEKGTALLVTEDEIGSLPAWQQEMLSDPGWNQPYIPPREGTPIEAPTYEMLIEETQKAMEQGMELAPRLQSGSKGVSWDDQGDYVPPTPVSRGEYETLAPNGDPTFGCNSNGANSNNGHAIEDVIDAATMLIPQRISYVEEGWTTANHFNETGGTGTDAQSAVYQLFATDREADPKDPNSTAEFGELSYRSDLAPGIAPGGDCSDAEAFAVTGTFWKRFNSMYNVLPAGAETPLYNLLVAPSSALSTTETSAWMTDGNYQEFYLGTLSACYGGGWIVGLISSASDCDDFNQFVADAQTTGFYVRPIYGVLLKRWQDGQLAGMAGPWEGSFGWPVFGPTAHANGTQVLTTRGVYYAWGMWFEKGFIWWIDYDQDMYPNTPDEAQAYYYTGSNVYCPDDGATYQKLAPAVYYGGEGELGVSVVVDSFKNAPADPWQPVRLHDSGTYYEVAIPGDSGLGQVYLAMHAHGYGGLTKNDATYGDCRYKYYVWAFRDGTIQAAGDEYDPAQASVTHVYGDLIRNLENVYVVRVQITDASFDLGATPDEQRAYGDSLPIHMGHGTGGGAEIMLIRNDGNAYPTGYDALKADLDTLGAVYMEVPYSATVATDFHNMGCMVAIWYRGGPQATGETVPYTTAWTAQEIDNYLKLMTDGHQVFLVSQSHGYQNSTTPLPYGWQVYYGCTNRPASVPGGQERHPWAASLALELGIGLYGGDYFPSAPTNLTGLIQNGMFGPDSAAATGERYDGAGSSTKLPITFELSTSGTQYCGIGYWSPWMGGWASGPYFRGGMAASPAFLGYNLGYLSWGNLQAPDQNIGFFPNYTHTSGPGKLWIAGYPYSKLRVLSAAGGATVSRAEVLKNILGWLNSGLTWGSGPAVAFSEYVGDPEIVMVKAISWFGVGGITQGAPSYTGFDYPDTSSTDVLRDFNASPPANTNYLYDSAARTAVENGVNPNDLDFQFPWYGYIYDPDASLTSGSPAVSGDEELIKRGGLLVADPDLVWTRVDPAMAGYVGFELNSGPDPGASAPSDTDTDDESDWQDEAGWAFDVPWAGYYVTAVDVVGTPALDTATRANYGSSASSLSFLSLDEPLSFETIAHWNQGLEYWPGQPAFLGWSLYPGHTAFRPTTGQFYGEDISWINYVVDLDIDPTIPVAGRDNSYWLNHNYYYTQALADGRVVDYDFSQIDGWNGDLDMDGTPGEVVEDKFPARVRLFTNYNAYDDWFDTVAPYDDDPTKAFPNHWPDNNNFIEGGCYLVDDSVGGFGGPPSIIAEEVPEDIAAAKTLVWTGTYPSAPSWECDATYTIEPGCAFPMQIMFDIDGDITLDPGNFDEDVMGTGRGAAGTYTDHLAFTAADIQNYVWSNGDALNMVIRGRNIMGDGYDYYAVPLWMGDIIMYEDFEGFVDSDITEGPNWFDWHNGGNVDRWYFHIQSIADRAWVAAPTSRSWVTSPGAELGTKSVFCDDGNVPLPSYTGGYWRPFYPPAQTASNNDDVYMHLRRACQMQSGNILTTCAYDPSWDGNFWWIYLDQYGQWTTAHTTPQILSVNMSEWMNTYVGGWRSGSGQFRFGNQMYIPYGGQGGFMYDNYLFTHANTPAPFQ